MNTASRREGSPGRPGSPRKYISMARLSLSNAFVYRSQLLGRLIIFTVIIYVFYSLWHTLYSDGAMGGFTLTQIMWYLLMSELVAFGGRSGVVGQLNDDIKTGGIAYLLNRPYHYVFYCYFTSLGEMSVTFTAFGVLALSIGLIFFGPLPGVSLLYIPLFILSFFLGITIQFFSQMCIALTSFWIEDNNGLMLIYGKFVLMLGVFFPVDMMPGWLQGIAKVLPFPYVAWAPARLVAQFSWPFFFQVVPLQLMWSIIIFALALFIYNRGVKNINANGG